MVQPLKVYYPPLKVRFFISVMHKSGPHTPFVGVRPPEGKLATPFPLRTRLAAVVSFPALPAMEPEKDAQKYERNQGMIHLYGALPALSEKPVWEPPRLKYPSEYLI